MALRVTPAITLEDEELVERFIRASGPGGQNVNKVATAVELRFDALASPNLPDRVKDRLRRLAGRRMTEAGVIILQADRYRRQSRNREDAIERLVELIREAAAPPPPKRRPTKPSFAARQRRMDEKTRRSSIKSGRGRVSRDD